MRRTDTLILAGAMDVLARDIESTDGAANMAIAEAADRLREHQTCLNLLEQAFIHVQATADALHMLDGFGGYKPRPADALAKAITEALKLCGHPS